MEERTVGLASLVVLFAQSILQLFDKLYMLVEGLSEIGHLRLEGAVEKEQNCQHESCWQHDVTYQGRPEIYCHFSEGFLRLRNRPSKAPRDPSESIRDCS